MTLGDFDASSVIYFKFTTTRPSTGAPYTLGGTPAISVYKDNSTTQSTTGVTLTVDFDSVTGLNHVAIDTSADGTFYAAGSFFDVVITTGTVDSVSAVGTVVGRFTIRKNSALKPTTAGRTLDVSAGGEAGLDWANIGSPTTTVALSGTTVGTATALTNAPSDSSGVTTLLTRVTSTRAGNLDYLDAAITSRMATYTQPTGFLAATFPAIVASTTNITAGTITTVSGNVNGNVTGSVGSVVGLTVANLDVAVSTRLATASYVAPDNAAIAAIEAQTDMLTFTVPNVLDANVRYVNGLLVDGAGTEADPWGPA